MHFRKQIPTCKKIGHLAKWILSAHSLNVHSKGLPYNQKIITNIHKSLTIQIFKVKHHHINTRTTSPHQHISGRLYKGKALKELKLKI